jgi:hypothetical protein
MPDYYELLDITPTASPAEVEAVLESSRANRLRNVKSRLFTFYRGLMIALSKKSG